ncbi:hypothetical protein, partial [Stenotrophomonas sp. 3diitr2024]|uniref:hypothetical protein n=1 Tax=Stenotrophomonas sp. 3diitr2024 TaxID=3345115 RepID=UPI0035CB0E9A
PLDVQVAGPLAPLQAQLEARGWKRQEQAGWQQALLMLDKNTGADELRVSGLLDRALDARMAEFSTTLLMLDRNEEVLSLTEGMAGAASN